MDVRCERCRAQYVFDDEQVTPAGLTVQCTNCGHVFKVKKKELVVTVPVKPEDMDGKAPLPANAVPRAPGPAAVDPAARPTEPERPKEKEWRVRQANGNVFTFRELTTLQKWIVEQKVSRDDEISLSGDQWKRLGNIAELASFFQVVEAAERARAQGAVPAVTPVPMAGVFGVPVQAMYPAPYPGPYATGGYPLPPAPPAAVPAAPPPSAAPAPAPAPAPARPRRAGPAVDVPLGEEELRAAGKGRSHAGALLVVLVLVAGGAAAAWRFRPELLGLPRRRPVIAVPITLSVPPPEPPQPALAGTPGGDATAAVTDAATGSAATPAAPATPAPSAAPVPAPEPVGDAAPPHEPEPVAKPEPAKAAPPKVAPKAPRGPKALVAAAGRLREKGDTERALDLYGRAVDEAPDDADALVGRGLCYLDLSQYPPAQASFQAALQARPDQPDALLGLAEAYRWQGKKAEAIKYYERYLAVRPEGEDAEAARNAIKHLEE